MAKEGFQLALVGFGAVIDILTGLVVDFELVSKYCHMCFLRASEFKKDSAEFIEWYEKHVSLGECNINHEGSSPAMEMSVAAMLWKRSEEASKMRYTVMLSDGDGKTYDHLQQMHVYGDNVEILKEECTNHVEKRLGTALRKLVETEKARKVTLGGRAAGSLKAATIQKLQNYYRIAIQKNAPDVQKMKKAILATIYHASSTPDNPNHGYCPEGEDSWCFYQRAMAMSVDPISPAMQSLVINELVFQKIQPIYQRLSEEELLERCTRVGTQNANECLHHVVWRKCPKEMFFSLKRYQLGATLAVGEFNMGMKTLIEMKASLRHEKLTQAAAVLAARKDQKRKRKSEDQDDVVAIRARKKVEKQKKTKESAHKKKEGVAYCIWMQLTHYN